MKNHLLFLLYISISLLPFIAQAEITAAALSARHPNHAFIELAENMIPVSKEELRHGITVLMHEEEKDITIKGDDAHLPHAYWIRSNILALEFPVGSSCRTEYSVEFPPHRAKFLSGKPMEQTRYTVRCPNAPLFASEVPGMGRSAFLVTAPGRTAESLNFSAASPLRYLFRNEFGEEVQTEVLPAELQHLPVSPNQWGDKSEVLLTGISPAVLQKLLQRHVNSPEQIQSDTLLPQSVLVLAKHPLTPNQRWSLIIQAEPSSGFESGTLVSDYDACNQSMAMNVSTQYSRGIEANDVLIPEICLEFNTPIRWDAFMKLFSRMKFRVNGAAAVGDEEKSLSDRGRNISVIPMPPAPLSVNECGFYMLYSNHLLDEEEKPVGNIEAFALAPEGSFTFNISLRGAQAGDEVEFIIPPHPGNDTDTPPLLRECRHCFRIEKPEPTVYPERDKNGSLCLRTSGADSITLTVGKIPAEKMIPLRKTLFQFHHCSETGQLLLEAAENITSQTIQIKGDNNILRSVISDNNQLYPPGCYILKAELNHGREPEYFLLNESNLRVACTPIPGHLAVFRKDTGEPVCSGSAQYREDGTAVEIADGLIRLPVDEQPDFLLIRSGEDSLLVNIKDWEPRAEEKSPEHRVEIFSDQHHYFAGENARIRGIVRTAGQEHITCGALCLKKDDKTLLRQANIPISTAGTFAATMPLPQEEGHYELSFSLGDNMLTEEESICIVPKPQQQLQVNARLQVETPPNADTWHVTLKVNPAELPACAESYKAVVTVCCGYDESEDYTASLPPSGEVSLSGRIGDGNNFPQFAWFRLRLVDSNGNDVWVQDERRILAAAGFRVVQRSGRLVLLDLQGNILNREQCLQAKISAEHVAEHRLDNGVVLRRRETRELYDGELTVPASCREGIRIPFHEEELANLITPPNPYPLPDAIISISATDADGHAYRWEQPFWLPHAERNRGMWVSADKGVLTLHFESPHQQDAHALLLVNENRAVPLFLKGGQKELQIPLHPTENRVIRCRLLSYDHTNRDDFLRYLAVEEATCTAEDSPARLHLRIRQEARNSDHFLQGQVTDTQGNPVSAELYLFAHEITEAPHRANLLTSLEHMFFPEERDISSFLHFPVAESPGNNSYNAEPDRISMEGGYVSHQFFEKLHDSDNIDHETSYRYMPPNYLYAGMAHATVVSWEDAWKMGFSPFPFSPLTLSESSQTELLRAADLRTDANGEFRIPLRLRSGTYRIYAAAIGNDGQTFGRQQTEITIP